ncbi:MAG: hypothetical protein S4CHLAM45_03790 [Chlamydiales bacterium]|nr:hypothetical protein [Chlamydiales bacterium]MCH9619233.1 hypothetical protein [Chlamydiales bacterium]MCH9622495.1 hypothetical protein [Chlamydiales bacterium]
MRILKNILLVILPVALMAGTVHFYNLWTDGFSVHQLTSNLPYNILYEVSPLPPKEKEKLTTLLDQPFRYIGKGCQFYAFESADKKYVIKFLKQKHLRTFSELKDLPLPRYFRKKADAKIARRKKRIANLFSSCKLAYEELTQESGLVYLHLNRTPLFRKEIEILDKLGLKHRLKVDDFEFILQERAIPAAHLFREILEDDLEKRVNQLIDLVKMRCTKGIRDRDRSFVQNVAFSSDGDRALFIDIGQFYKDPTILFEEEIQADIKKRLGNLRHFLEENRSDLLPRFDELVIE